MGPLNTATSAAPRPPFRKKDRKEQSHNSGELAIAAALDRRTYDDEDEDKRDDHGRDCDEERATGQAVPSPLDSRTHVTTMPS
jgi:hypothetical protein